MTNQNLLYQIGFTLIRGIGNITGRQILDHIDDVSVFFKEKDRLLEQIPGLSRKIVAEIKNADLLKRAEKEILFLEKNKIEPFFITNPNYPSRLKECVDAPLLFYFKGNANLESQKVISIVGTRNATSYGKEMIDKLCADIKQSFPETLIVSGLAYGVDISVHKRSLKEDLATVAVLAHGLDRIYPSTHRSTAVEMLNNGGLLTEYMSETNPDKPNFIKRNRIIAGMADCTILVESAAKGGALITCNIADSYNRDVFAYPGKSTDKYSEGCNTLIKYRKAALVCGAEDVFNEMNWTINQPQKAVQQTLPLVVLSEEEKRIVELISTKNVFQLNSLCMESGFPMNKLSPLLFELEMKGVIKCMPGGLYQMCK